MDLTTTDFASVINPFAAFMDPTASVLAHERLAGSLAQCTVHRPLDKRMTPKDADPAIADQTLDVMVAEIDAGFAL